MKALYRVVAWVALSVLAPSAFAADCFTREVNGVMVPDCESGQAFAIPDAQVSTLKVQPLSANQGQFGEAGKFGLYGPNQKGEPMRVEMPATPAAAQPSPAQ